MAQRKPSTPPLLPWIAAGATDRDKSKNKYVHKKNSKIDGLELGESNAEAFFRDNEHGKKSTWEIMNQRKPTKVTHEQFLAVSQKSEEDRKSLQSKIKDIFEEEEGEEDKRSRMEQKDRRQSRSRSPKRSKSYERDRSPRDRSPRDRKSKHRNKSKRRSKSEERYRHRDSGDHQRRRSPVVKKYRQDEGFFEPEYAKRRDRQALPSHNDSSGIGSYVEDIEDGQERQSIEYIDSVDTRTAQPKRVSQLQGNPAHTNQYGHNQAQGNPLQDQYGNIIGQGNPMQDQYGNNQGHRNPGLHNVPNPPNPALVDIPTDAPWPNRVSGYTNNPYGLPLAGYPPNNPGYPDDQGFQNPNENAQLQTIPYYHPRDNPRYQRHSLQSQFASIPYSDDLSSGNSGYGFQSVPLQHRGRRNSAPEAWLVFPKGGGAPSQSVSRRVSKSLRNYTAKPMKLRESVGNRLKRSFTRINRDTPIERFGLIEEESKEVRRHDKRRNAMIAAVATVVGCLLLGLALIGIAAAVAGSGSNTGVQGAGIFGNGGSGSNSSSECNKYQVLDQSWRKIVSRYSGTYRCDQTLQEGWYRFAEPGGTFMPTSAPGSDASNRICGASMVAWVDGAHPKVHEGVVSRRFCFQWETGPCQFRVTSQIRTCTDASTGGTYYVYHLKIPFEISCNFAYCAI